MAVWFYLLISGSCFGLFITASIVSAHTSRSSWASYRAVAALLCWLTLGLVPALALVGLGAVVACFFHPKGDRWRVARRVLAAVSSVLVSAALLAMLGGGVPYTTLSQDSVLQVSVAVLGGLFASHAAESRFVGRFTLDVRQVISEIVLVWLTLFLPPVAHQGNLGIFLVVVSLLALHVWSLLEVDRARAALRRRAHELTLLNDIGQFTSDNLNLDDVLWNIYEHVVQLVDVSIFYIAIYDDENQMLDFRLVVADGKRIVWRPRKLGRGTAEYVIRHKKPLRIRASDRRINPDLRALDATTPYMDYLGVPLLVSARVVGVMSVMSMVSEESFGEDEIRILQTIANQVGLAVRNATLYTRQTDLVEKLSRVNESVQQVLFSNNRDSALESACQTAVLIADTSKAAVFLTEAGQLRLKTSLGLTSAHIESLQQNPPPLSDSVRFVPDIHEQIDPALSELAAQGGFRALIELPLQSGRLHRGLLALYYNTPHTFRQQDIDLLSTLANQITAMLENVQLFEVMEHYAYEMSQLVQLSRISTSSLNLTSVVHDIADMLQQMTGVSRVAILLLEDQQARLLAVVNGGSASGGHIMQPFAAFLQITGSEPPLPRAFQLTDAQLSPEIAAQMAEYGEQTLALIPLVVENDVLGAVLLGSQQPRQFQTPEWQFIEMAANQIATQINNIRLHEKIQKDLNRRLAQVAVVEDIAQQVSSSLDFNQIIGHVLEAAVKATDADLVLLALMTDAEQLWVIEQRSEQGGVHWRYFSGDQHVGLAGYVLAEGRPVIVKDNQTAPFYASDYGATYLSSLGVPLLRAGEVIGALAVESKQPAAFSHEQNVFMTSLAGHAVMSIENARFLEERRHEIDLLKSLRDLSLWLVSADDTRSVGYEILETALQLLQGKQAVLFTYEADQLRPLAKLWFSEQDSPNGEEVLPFALAQQAARSGELVHLVDVREQPTYTSDFDYDSVIAIPLKRARQVRYVLVVTFDGFRQLIERDLNTIDLLAGQSIGHLENASLHERIRAARDQMQTILNSTRDGLILLDSDVRIIETNPSARELLGVELSQYVGQYFPAVLLKQVQETGDDFIAENVAELVMTMRTQPEAETRRELQRRSGSKVSYIEEIGLPVRGQAGEITGRLLVLRDVTDARLLEEQREDLTDMVIHDLRGPLGSIQNAMDLVIPRLSEPEEYEDNAVLLRASRDNAARLLLLVETLLDISRMQRPGLELKCEAVAVDSMVQTAFTAMLTSAQKAHLTLRAELPADLPPVYVDREKIERVLINLLDNAVRYTPTGGDIQVTACALPAAGLVEVRVADSGPGIPRERRANIFERFRRIPGHEPRRGHKGHGLGLNFTKMAVEHHGGSIHIADDCALPGACLVFTLPIAE